MCCHLLVSSEYPFKACLSCDQSRADTIRDVKQILKENLSDVREKPRDSMDLEDLGGAWVKCPSNHAKTKDFTQV